MCYGYIRQCDLVVEASHQLRFSVQFYEEREKHHDVSYCRCRHEGPRVTAPGPQGASQGRACTCSSLGGWKEVADEQAEDEKLVLNTIRCYAADLCQEVSDFFSALPCAPMLTCSTKVVTPEQSWAPPRSVLPSGDTLCDTTRPTPNGSTETDSSFLPDTLVCCNTSCSTSPATKPGHWKRSGTTTLRP